MESDERVRQLLDLARDLEEKIMARIEDGENENINAINELTNRVNELEAEVTRLEKDINDLQKDKYGDYV
jgi:TolA-binding protein